MSSNTYQHLGDLFTKVTGETTITAEQQPEVPPSADDGDPDANPGEISAYITAAAKADLDSEVYEDVETG